MDFKAMEIYRVYFCSICENSASVGQWSALTVALYIWVTVT